jgi:hypothetical protein
MVVERRNMMNFLVSTWVRISWRSMSRPRKFLIFIDKTCSQRLWMIGCFSKCASELLLNIQYGA